MYLQQIRYAPVFTLYLATCTVKLSLPVYLTLSRKYPVHVKATGY